MTPTTEQLKDLLARAPDGPWSADYASGEINGGASGGYPVIDMNQDTFDHSTACVTLDDSEIATLGLIAIAPTLAAEVVRLRGLVEEISDSYSWWSEDPYDRDQSVVYDAIRQALDATIEK